MKKTLNTFLILSVIFLVTGSMFKLVHFMFADILLLLALILTIPLSSLLFCIHAYRKTKSIIILLGFIPVFLLCTGISFLLNYYPFGLELFYIGFVACGLYLLVLFIMKITNAKKLSSFGLKEVLSLMVLVGLILTGYVAGNRLNWRSQLANELRFISLQKDIKALQEENQFLYTYYSTEFADLKIQDETKKVLYSLDTLQNGFFQHFLIDNDTSRLFEKNYLLEMHNYFDSNSDSSRLKHLQLILKEYVDSLSEREKQLNHFSEGSKYIDDLLSIESSRKLNGQYFSWGAQFSGDPGVVLVFLGQLKHNVLLAENTILNNILRKKLPYPMIAGKSEGSLSK